MNSPMIPNVTAEQYEAERGALFAIYNSMGRIVQIGPFKFNLVAADWPTIKDAETAASKVAVILNTEGAQFKDWPVNTVLDHLGEAIRREMDMDDSRPFGMCFVAEPL